MCKEKKKRKYEFKTDIILENRKNLEIKVYKSLNYLRKSLGISGVVEKEQFLRSLRCFCTFEEVCSEMQTKTKAAKPIKITSIYSDEQIEHNIEQLKISFFESKNVLSKFEYKEYSQMSEMSRRIQNKCGVYVVTNGEKAYIGCTLVSFRARFRGHLASYKNQCGNKGSELLATDPNAKMIYLCTFENDISFTEAVEIEAQFIKLFKQAFNSEDILNQIIKDVEKLPSVDNINIEYLMSLSLMRRCGYCINDILVLQELINLGLDKNLKENFNGVYIPIEWFEEADERIEYLKKRTLLNI